MSHRSQAQGHDPAAEAERGAYNRAFSELGLECYWDAGTYRQLQSASGDKPFVQAYIEANHPHLLQAYAGNSLAIAVDKVRRRVSEAARH
jgi:hypothetical protein